MAKEKTVAIGLAVSPIVLAVGAILIWRHNVNKQGYSTSKFGAQLFNAPYFTKEMALAEKKEELSEDKAIAKAGSNAFR